MDHDLRRARPWWLAVVAAVVLVAVLLYGATRDDNPRASLSAGAGDETTSTSVEPSSTTTSLETTTTTATATTTTTRAYVRPVASSIVPTTRAPKPLLMSSVRNGLGAPCRDESTTTTGDAIGPHEIDGCWFFVYWPTAETDVNVRLHSNRGVDQDLLGPPCQEHEGECHAYMGPVYDRAVGERECFWLTTDDLGWAHKSNDVCFDWPQRP